MSTYARLGYSLSDTESLIPAQAEDRGRTANGLIQASTLPRISKNTCKMTRPLNP
jgi:hypothetical protein